MNEKNEKKHTNKKIRMQKKQREFIFMKKVSFFHKYTYKKHNVLKDAI